jgi:hypothetical protein
LSFTLMATHEGARRAIDAGDDAERAERAAAAGIEWAAARVVGKGVADATTTIDLGDGASVVVDLDNTSPPHATAEGRFRGAAVTLAADFTIVDGAPLPYALASLDGSSRLDHVVTVIGSAYFGAPSAPIDARSDGSLAMYGDLELVAGTAPSASLVTHFQGTTRVGVSACAAPVVDTRPFETMTSGAVPVRRYSGSTELTGILDGVIVVTLDAAQTLTIRDATINGTVVVTPALDLLGKGGLLGTGLLPPLVRIRGATTIQGGTAVTGNLALLAECELEVSSTAGASVTGVTLVDHLSQLSPITFRGQLVTLHNVDRTSGPFTVERPNGFAPQTPIGIRWPGPSSVRVKWLGTR